MKPGKDEEEFKIIISDNFTTKGAIVENYITNFHWFWKMLGFNISYKTEILANPELDGDLYQYSCKLREKHYYWLNFKLKTIKL